MSDYIKLSNDKAADNRAALEQRMGDLESAYLKQRELVRDLNEREYPAGHFKHLPKLLDQRRLEYDIPPGVFQIQPIYDRAFLWVIKETWEEGSKIGSIWIPDAAEDRMITQTVRSVLCAAGPLALDQLRSNGVDLGHIVKFTEHAPYAIKVGRVGTQEPRVHVVRAGDVIASEDLAENLAAGRVGFSYENNEHLLVDESGQKWAPEDPGYQPDEYR